MDKLQAIRDMYIKGHNISNIAKTYNITRQTIYKYKQKEKENNIDWDALALAKSRDIANVKRNEEEFVLTLINNFEKSFKELENLDLQKRLEILKDYTNTYYKLKAPIKNNFKAAILEATTNTINIIATLATKQDRVEVTDFLSTNADLILEKVLKSAN